MYLYVPRNKQHISIKHTQKNETTPSNLVNIIFTFLLKSTLTLNCIDKILQFFLLEMRYFSYKGMKYHFRFYMHQKKQCNFFIFINPGWLIQNGCINVII